MTPRLFLGVLVALCPRGAWAETQYQKSSDDPTVLLETKTETRTVGYSLRTLRLQHAMFSAELATITQLIQEAEALGVQEADQK